jgi:GntR family transcriptional repressor for pyruvate dehydrogenase complex
LTLISSALNIEKSRLHERIGRARFSHGLFMLKDIARSKLCDVIARQLKSHILSENLKPGDRLPTEAQLAEMFGVSRLSLREATKSLGFLGIVEAKPGQGLSVGRVDMDRVTEYLGFHPALHDVSPQVLIDTRVVIEVGVLASVASRMAQDAGILDRLQDVNDRLSRARSLQGWVELDIAFHRELISASGLTPLMAFADVLSVFFQRFRESIKAAEWRVGVQSHQQIIDALGAGQVAQAEQLLREHIESHRERLGLVASGASSSTDAAAAGARAPKSGASKSGA